MQSKADTSQLNLTHETNNQKNGGKQKIQKYKTDVLRSTGKQTGESVVSVLKKKKGGYGEKDLQKRNVL